MADYFISKLPSGHAIKDLTKAIATNTVRSEPMIIASPETTVPLLRRQCAAVVWVRSDSYSRDSLEQLPATERAYLLKLFSLSGGGSNRAQAKRIDDHVLSYPLAAGAPPPAAGGAGGGAGGGGAGGPPPPSQGPGGLVLALLDADYASALGRLPRSEMTRLLTAAGVPTSDSDTLDGVRNKCAAAAWAAGQLRRPSDVSALPGSIPSMVCSAFSIPDGWTTEARDQALAAILESCRHSTWAVDPSSSLGLISPTKSAIFRAVESIAFPARQSLFSQATSHLSAQDSSKAAALLAASGHSVSDITFRDGSWVVQSSGASGSGHAASSSAGMSGVSTSVLEGQIRTLHVEPYNQLTAEERKDQANKNKATAGKKRQQAFPGDAETDIVDGTLYPLAEWPWEQQLPLKKSDSYSLCGRIVRNVLQWCNRNFTDALMQVTFKSHQEEQDRIHTRFTEFVAEGRFDGALLCAHQAASEAREEMKAVVANAQLFAAQHPTSVMIAHIAQRRKAQENELAIYLADLSHRINEAAQKTPDTASQHATAAFMDFLEGWMTKTDIALIRPETLQQASTSASAAFTAPRLTPPGASSSGTGGGIASNKASRTASATTASGAGGSGGGNRGKGGTPSRSEERRVGKECRIGCRSRWSPYH